MLEKKPNHRGRHIALFVVGLVIGAVVDVFIGGSGILALTGGTSKPLLSFLFFLVPFVIAAIFAVRTLMRGQLTTGWLLIGITFGALGPLLICGGLAFTNF